MEQIYFYFDAIALEASVTGDTLSVALPAFNGPILSDHVLSAAKDAGLSPSIIEAIHSEAADILHHHLLVAALRKARR